MKFNKKNSKLFKNTKKFVYVSAITGVLLTGTQAGRFAFTYTAHADETVQTSLVTITFTDQYGNKFQKPAGDNQFYSSVITYPVQNAQVNKSDLLNSLSDYPGVSTSDNNVSDTLDLSRAGSYTYKLTQPTPAADKKDVSAKLPQTGDNTNQARAIALGVATIAVGLGLAYFGLRRKNN